jgi:hypothetical protein
VTNQANARRLRIGCAFFALLSACSGDPSASSDASGGAAGSLAGGAPGSGGAPSGGVPVGGRGASADQNGGAGGGGAVSNGGSSAGGGSAGGSTGSGGAASAGGSTAAGGSAGDGGSGGAGQDGGGGAGPSDGGIPEPNCRGGKVVHFVYFVEADKPVSEAQRSDVERQAFVFQRFWFDQLGVTFYVNYPVVDVIRADHAADWYLNTPDGIHSDPRWYRLGNVKNEVYAKLGIRNFDPNHRVVNYPTTRYDGHVGGNFGGAWIRTTRVGSKPSPARPARGCNYGVSSFALPSAPMRSATGRS